MALFGVDSLKRRLYGTNSTSVGRQGIFSRGANVYNGGSANAGGGRPSSGTGFSDKAGGSYRTTPETSQPPTQNYRPPGGFTFENNWGIPRNTSQQPTTSPTMSTPRESPQQGGGGNNGAPEWANVYNPEFAELMRQINAQRSQIEAEKQHLRQRTEEDASLARENAARWRQDSLENWKYATADQGLVHSGINIDQQGEIGEDYLRGLDELQRNKARMFEDLDRAAANRQWELENQQRMAEQQNAQYQAIQAEMAAMQQAIAEANRPTSTGRVPLPGAQASGAAGRVTGINPPAQSQPSTAAIANKLGFSVGNVMDDADYLKVKDQLGIKVGRTLDAGDKRRIESALKRRLGR